MITEEEKNKTHCLICQTVNDLVMVVHRNHLGQTVGMIFCCTKHLYLLPSTEIVVKYLLEEQAHSLSIKSPYEPSES